MPSKKKRKLEVEDGSPDIPVLRALREELSLPYLPELFYPNEGDDEDPMRGRETRESATSSAPDSWTSVEFREIDGVKRVVGLSLDNRLLKEVPMTHLKKLDALESLDLTANELYGLPTEFGQIFKAKLKKLAIGRCRLVFVPPEVFQLDKLEKLSLYRNYIVKFPGRLATRLKGSLRELNLSGNRIETIPPEIQQMERLTRLLLSDMAHTLTGVPKELGDLKNLEYLNLHDTNLHEVPKELGKLANLRELVLSKNWLLEVPKEFGGMKKLETLNVRNNPMLSVPRAVHETGATVLFAHYRW